MTNPQLVDRLSGEAKRIEEDCTFSGKGHFEAARQWGWWNLGLGVPAVLIAAGAGFSGFQHFPVLAGALALTSAAVTAVLTFLKPNERQATHQKTGAQYLSLKNKARFYREVELIAGARDRVLMQRLRALVDERNALNEASPEIPRPAFARARRGIEAGEAAHQADRGSNHESA